MKEVAVVATKFAGEMDPSHTPIAIKLKNKNNKNKIKFLNSNPIHPQPKKPIPIQLLVILDILVNWFEVYGVEQGFSNFYKHSTPFYQYIFRVPPS